MRFSCVVILVAVGLSAAFFCSADGARIPVRRRALAAGQDFPVHGDLDDVGEWYIEVELGTPSQKFDLQIDTGSSDLLIYAHNCTGCGNDTNRYNIAASKTGNFVPCMSSCTCFNYLCGFDDEYADGSNVTGIVVSDHFVFGGSDGLVAKGIQFGTIENSNVHPFEPPKFDGIIGVAFSSLSAWGGVPPLFEVFDANDLTQIFTLCLTNDHDGSSMTVGEPVDASDFDWTPITDKSWYVVDMEDMKVGGTSLGVPASVYNDGDAIVDSGTTYFYIPTKAWEAFMDALTAMCSSTNLVGVCGVSYKDSIFDNYCFEMTSAEVDMWPTISISLSGSVSLDLTPAQYLVDNGGQYCLGVGNNGSGQGTIIGDPFFIAYNIAFDIANSRIGFADQSTCKAA